ncbi:TIR domain-containing protein [Luteimonas sp. WGS1318]|uniref:TIR domain-containing protein n=1 Tax=Luteimonas sp. WGS1318 TaxID=3366815 RepID=UPI00372D27F0
MSDEKSISENPILKSLNPMVFISHDTRDAELAEAFSNLLKSVSAGVLKSFRTSDRRGNQGIEYGIEWYPEIIKNIQSASDVVCLLTERSVDRPWILFEAGMAKGKLDTPILGVALGIELKTASTGPFAQFQNCADDEDSLTKLVFQLVDRIPGSEPDRDTIRFQVGKFKKNVEEILEKLTIAENNISPSKRQKTDEIENSSAKLFEEIKIMFQDLPSRIDRSEAGRPMKRRRRFHPGMLEELLFGAKNPALGIRVGLSLLREQMPWIYDEGNILVAKMQAAKTPASKKKLFSEFEELLMMSTRNPYMEKFLVESEEDYRLLREIPEMILHAADRMLRSA